MKRLAKRPTESPILILALVQAATTFLRNGLANALDLPVCRRVSGGVWNQYEVLSPVALGSMRDDCAVAYSHAHPDALNVRILNAALDKVVVNVRDPRQVVVSLVHFIDNHVAGNPSYFRAHGLPDDYLNQPFAWKLAYHLEHTYPMLVDWIRGWTDVADRGCGDTRFLVIQHSEMKADRVAFFRRIYRFYNVSDVDAIEVPAEHDGKNHNYFRSGRNDEWREILSRPQIQWVNDGLPESLMERFQWAR